MICPSAAIRPARAHIDGGPDSCHGVQDGLAGSHAAQHAVRRNREIAFNKELAGAEQDILSRKV